MEVTTCILMIKNFVFELNKQNYFFGFTKFILFTKDFQWFMKRVYLWVCDLCRKLLCKWGHLCRNLCCHCMVAIISIPIVGQSAE